MKYMRDYSDFIDKTITEAADSLKTPGLNLCLAATGGYGRRELAPESDVDLLFFSESPLSAPARKFVEALTAHLWTLGLKISCAARTREECAEALAADLHFRTALLDRRPLWGPKNVFAKLDSVFGEGKQAMNPGAFAAAKLAERDARHAKMGDTRYCLEPNLKEGKGALRDVQTLFWIMKYADREDLLDERDRRALDRAHAFFQSARSRLHLLAERAEDRLSFGVQPALAERMGHAGPAAFMKEYFLAANETGHLTRALCAALEEEYLVTAGTAGTKKTAFAAAVDGFPLRCNRLAADPACFAQAPENALRLFRAAQSADRDIHPAALRKLRDALPALREKLPGDAQALRLFLDIMTDGRRAEQTLRRMNEAGLIAALVPAFENVVAHMQYDMYHAFTADEHTLRAVGLLHRIEAGDLAQEAPLATALAQELAGQPGRRRALFAAMFLHDIAKGTGGGHAQKGAQVAREFCPKAGLNAAEAETAAWLVENHLLMTMTAFKRDLSDPETITAFAGAVQSPARLDLLAVMTAADIMAVGPDRWTAWKAGLLDDLHRRTAAVLSGRPADDDALAVIAQKKVRRLAGAGKDAVIYLSDHAPKYFWHCFPPETVAEFAAALHGRTGGAVVKITPRAERGFTEVLVHAPDRNGLFATLAGAMAAGGASIAEARIFTLGNGMALDVFQVQDLKGRAHDNAAFLQKTIKDALAGKINLEAEIAALRKRQPRRNAALFTVVPQVLLDNRASSSHTLVEVTAPDRPGLLHDITAALTRAGLQISAARVATFGSRAADVFYVKDLWGLKIRHHDRLRAVEEAVMEVL